MYFTAEMLKLGVKPNRLTYDRLILVCAQTGDVGDALLYYEEMRGMGWVPRPRTFEVLISESVAQGDERAVAVTRDYGEVGDAGGRLGYFRRLVEKRFEDKSAEREDGAKGTGQEQR